MVNDVLEMTQRNLDKFQPRSAEDIRNASEVTVNFSAPMGRNVEILREFLHARVYRHSRINRICAKARQIVSDLFDFFMAQPSCLPTSWFAATEACGGDDVRKARIIADYIAGMTDRFAVQEHRKLFSSETMI
jgi:dGTPase